MKEVKWGDILREVATSFGIEMPEKESRSLELGEEDKRIYINFYHHDSFAINYHIGTRVATQLSPITFDRVTSWKIQDNQVWFRRQIKGFDETLKISANGEFILGSTNPADWERRGK